MLSGLAIHSLTLSRAIASPFIARLILTKRDGLALLLVLLALATDIVDGWAARYFKKESIFGRVLDPLADKIFMLFTFYALLKRYSWIVGESNVNNVFYILLFRDLILGLGTFLIWKKNHAILSASWMGKISMGLQTVAVVALLILTPERHFLHENVVHSERALSASLFLCSIVISIASMIMYAYEFFKIMMTSRKIPNVVIYSLAVSRVMVSPFVGSLVMAKKYQLALVLAVLVLATDVGRLQKRSALAWALNIAADKLLVLSFLYALCGGLGDSFYAVCGFHFYIFPLRDLIVGLGAFFLWKKGRTIPVSWLGRVSMWLYAAIIIFYCVGNGDYFWPPSIALAFSVSIVSAIHDALCWRITRNEK